MDGINLFSFHLSPALRKRCESRVSPPFPREKGPGGEVVATVSARPKVYNVLLEPLKLSLVQGNAHVTPLHQSLERHEDTLEG